MKNTAKLIAMLWLFYFAFCALEAVASGEVCSNPCGFPAIYNFGDSNSDTGGRSAALKPFLPPNGETFFGHPSGRACDGRLLIDFIAGSFKFPFLSPYLDSIGSNFRHGANFATGGSSIRPGGFSPFHLGIQVYQFRQFKARTTALYNRLSHNNSLSLSNLPKPEDFSKALYIFDIGQNDIAYGFDHTTEDKVRASIPDILNHFVHAVQLVYKEGARFFWIHNTGPIGCLPDIVMALKHKDKILDRNGCAKSRNVVAQEFNRQLKYIASQLKVQLPGAKFTYVDIYSAKYALISDAKNQGFVDPLKICCGSYHGHGYHIRCGKKATLNGTVLYGGLCKHPSKHISWDGTHYSEAANLWIANRILNGSLSDPPLPIGEACR